MGSIFCVTRACMVLERLLLQYSPVACCAVVCERGAGGSLFVGLAELRIQYCYELSFLCTGGSGVGGISQPVRVLQ